MAGRLPPIRIGATELLGIDWTAERDAVTGDAISGTPSIAVSPSGPTLGTASLVSGILQFSFTAADAGTYTLSSTASFAPSGRVLPRDFIVTVGDPPATEPVTLEEMRMQLRLDTSGTPPTHPEDDLVLSLITAARQHAEAVTGRTLVTTTRDTYFDAWPDVLELPNGPAQAITFVKYVAEDGTLATLDSALYRTDLASDRPRITPAYGETWPCALPVTNAIQVRYSAGPAEPVAEALRLAIRQLAAFWYESRATAGDIPASVTALLQPHRIFFMA